MYQLQRIAAIACSHLFDNVHFIVHDG
jgi:hypothetical protein